jgi:hypothetical protein
LASQISTSSFPPILAEITFIVHFSDLIASILNISSTGTINVRADGRPAITETNKEYTTVTKNNSSDGPRSLANINFMINEAIDPMDFVFYKT